jgi:uncharacterized protein (UPF0332 family)
MREFELDKYIEDSNLLEKKINDFLQSKIITIKNKDLYEIKGHQEKANHNLQFINDIMDLDYLDWAITGCYYASYHAAIALILTKNYFSKNHLATLLLLIREFYQNGIDKKDIETLQELLDYQDILFDVESKNKREDATYSTKTRYSKKEVLQLRMKSALFVAKVVNLIENNSFYVELNALILTVLKVKKADKSEVLSYAKTTKVIDTCRKYDGDISLSSCFNGGYN